MPASMNRRVFARRICAAAALSTLPAQGVWPDDRSLSMSKLLLKHFPAEKDIAAVGKPQRVLIIGAGVAGLSAARILQDAGIPTTVIEARQRIGGRTWTVDVLGSAVDMNGGYLHDMDVNKLAGLYQDAGWPVDDTAFLDIHANSFDAVTGESLSVYGKARVAYHMQRYFAGPPNAPASIEADFPLEQWTRKYFAEAKLGDPDGRLIESLIRTSQSTDGAEISVYWNDKAGKHGGKWVFPRAGFRQLVDALAQGLDIRRDQAARRIALRGDVMVVDTATEEFEASHVLVTVPLGVLQASGLAFEPGLPSDKVEAIRNIGFAKMEKFAIGLSEPIEDDDFTLRVYYDARTGCRLTFQNQSQRLGKPIVVAYAHTDYVNKFVLHPPKERERIVVEALRAILKQPGLNPKYLVQSSWTDNPFSRGAYSFIKVHGGPQHMKTLATPACGGRLLFAGEATDADRFAFVDGAVATGVREARRLLGNETKQVRS